MLRVLLKLEAAVPREERRLERELRCQRATFAAIVADIADRVDLSPAPHELLTMTRALAEAGAAQRLASGALLALANVRLERARQAVVDAEPAADEVPDVH